MVLLIGLSPVGAVGQSTEDYPSICFRINMDGDPVGYDCVSVSESDGLTRVRRSIKIRVSYFGFNAYLYRHEDREVWKNGRLLRLETWTNDNGESFHVRARRTGNKVLVDAGDTRYYTTSKIVPTSYWNRRLVEQSRLLDTQSGRIRSVQVTRAGNTDVRTDGGRVSVTKYRLRGDVRLTLGYDRNGVWRFMRFEKSGSTFRYEPVAVSASSWRSDSFYDRTLNVGDLEAGSRP